MRGLETKNATEQNTLNDLITSYKRETQELQRRVHELEGEMNDREAQADLKNNLMRQDLESQKQANEMLKARNNFLQEWSHELERDLKSERVSNVNILQDTNISRRETVQMREQVRVELEAIKDK
jgi:cell division protein FtsB